MFSVKQKTNAASKPPVIRTVFAALLAGGEVTIESSDHVFIYPSV